MQIAKTASYPYRFIERHKAPSIAPALTGQPTRKQSGFHWIAVVASRVYQTLHALDSSYWLGHPRVAEEGLSLLS